MLSFDPSGLLSGNQCVEFLKEKNIIISQKLGARLLALKNHGIEVTLAALEDAVPASPYEKFLLSPELIEKSNNTEKLKEIILSYVEDTPLKFFIENDTLKISSFYEEPAALLPSIKKNTQNPLFIQQQSISPQSLLNDRKYIEETAFAFLDSQDEFTVSENLRKLVRISVMSNQNPSNLLVTAINKENQAIWIQTAEIIKELLDKQFGNELKKLVTAQSKAESEIFFSEMLEDVSSAPFKTDVLVAILPHLLKKNDSLDLLLRNLDKLEAIINKKPELIVGIVSGVIKISGTINPMDVKQFRLFLKKLSIGADSVSLIVDELKQESDTQAKVYLLWFLASFENITPELKLDISMDASRIILKNIKNPSWLEAIKTVFINFIPQSLEVLGQISKAAQSIQDSSNILSLIFDIWEYAYRENAIGTGDLNKILSTIIYCIDNELQAETKKILTLSLMRNEEILKGIKDFKKGHALLLDCSYWVFTNDKVDRFRTSMPELINKIDDNSFMMFQEKLNYKYKSDEEISEDELDFLTELALSGKNNENRMSAVSFLNQYGKTKKLGTALYLRTKLINPKETSQEIAELILQESENIDNEDLKLKILFQLLPLLPENTSENKIENFISNISNVSQSEIDIFMELVTKFYSSGFNLKNTDRLLIFFMKENAFKITMPPLISKMKANQDNSIMKLYDVKKWNWENIGQSLFCSLEIACSKNIDTETQNQAINVIMYVFRHWAEKNTVFMLKDDVVFRIIRELAERKEDAKKVLDEIAKTIGNNFKGTEKIENADLLRFMSSCSPYA